MPTSFSGVQGGALPVHHPSISRPPPGYPAPRRGQRRRRARRTEQAGHTGPPGHTVQASSPANAVSPRVRRAARRAPAPTLGQGCGMVTTPYPSTTLTQRLPSVSGAARHLASRRPATRAGPAAERAQRISADGADQRPRVIALRHGDGATVDVEENDWARSARRA